MCLHQFPSVTSVLHHPRVSFQGTQGGKVTDSESGREEWVFRLHVEARNKSLSKESKSSLVQLNQL